VQQGQVSHTMMQRTKQHAKIQHNKAQLASFYRNKRYATSQNKGLTPANQKLVRQLGQRPRPGAERKVRERDHERREAGSHECEQEHEHEQQDSHRERGREREGGQGGGQNPSGDQGRNGQPQGQGEQRQRGGANDERKPREQALKVAAVRTRKPRGMAAPTELQAIAAAERESPRLGETLAVAYTREVVKLATQLEFGPAIALLMVLDMAGPTVLRRPLGRLHALRNSTLAQRALRAGNAAAGAQLLGHTLDLTLARQRFAIVFGDDDQSVAAARQRLIDASGATAKRAPANVVQPASGASGTSGPGASETSQPVRVPPAAPDGAA
jgi:hypothetical protein